MLSGEARKAGATAGRSRDGFVVHLAVHALISLVVSVSGKSFPLSFRVQSLCSSVFLSVTRGCNAAGHAIKLSSFVAGSAGASPSLYV